MFGHQEEVTVRELMTRNPDAVGAGASVADVHDWLVDHGYTAAPLRRDDPPYLYVTREHLASVREDAPEDQAYEHADRIDLSTLLSPDLGFEDLLVELEAEPFYFVGWHGTVAGIVTRSDLNKPAAHAFLYARIGELEMLLRDLVDAEANWRGTLATLQREGAGETTEYDVVDDRRGARRRRVDRLRRGPWRRSCSHVRRPGIDGFGRDSARDCRP